MIVYMKLIRDGMTIIFHIYDSRAEAERMVKVLSSTTDKWEFYTK